MTIEVSVVVGNPKPGSRTLAVATGLAHALAESLDADRDILVVDLAQYAGEVFDPSSPSLTGLATAVASRRLLVAASPTYKGSYTGLFKAFFDRYGSDALHGVVAVAAMTGAAQVHALAVEVHLRPLLIELGATVPARGLYVTEAEIAAGERPGSGWLEAATPLLRRAAT